MTVAEVLDYYEAIAGTNSEGKQIKKAIKELKNKLGDTSHADQRFMLYQYTDDDKRLDFGYLTDADKDDFPITNPEKGDFIFLDVKNKIPFLNYTFKGGASDVETGGKYKFHPMLASANWFDSWNNLQLVKTLSFTDIIRRLREVRETYEGVGTEQVPADDGTGGAKALPPGVSLKRQPPTTIDPQAMQMILAELQNSMSATTSASALGNLSKYSNTAFSTMNAIVQVEMGKLNPQKNIIQDTIMEVLYLFCEWAQFTDKPLQAWRDEDKKMGDRVLPRGEEIQFGKDDYDLYRTFIKVMIVPETPTDKAQQANILRQMVDMGMSAEEAMEQMNIPHADLQMDKRAFEQLKDGMIQALIQKMIQQKGAEVQLWLQQKSMELQQQMQPPQAAPGQMPQGGSPQFPGGAGFDPSQGGQPPIQSVPGVGREQLAGTDRTGQDIAA